MIKCTKPPTVRYVMIRNEWARDDRLSLKAVGLLTYLHSHADGYELSTAQIIRDHTDGKDAVRTGLEELEAAGYLTRLRGRTSGGHWGETDYVLADPFDAHGRLIPAAVRETRALDAEDGRETRQSGLSAAGEPHRIIRPIEDQGIEDQESPTDSPPLTLVPGPAPKDRFDEFWAAYPRKVSKDAARRAWRSALRRATPSLILDRLRAYPFSPDPQYIPHPSTWLNGGRWADDPAAVRPRRDTAAYGPGLRPSATADDYHDPGWRVASQDPPNPGDS